jgi:hypothetical protein
VLRDGERDRGGVVAQPLDGGDRELVELGAGTAYLARRPPGHVLAEQVGH